MGIYYNPAHQTNYPNIGGQQPLTPSYIAANKATFPTPPPINGGADVSQLELPVRLWYEDFKPPPPTFMGAEQPWNHSFVAANPATFPTNPPFRGFHDPKLQPWDIASYDYGPVRYVTLLLGPFSNPYEGQQLSPALISMAPLQPTLVSQQAVYNSWNYPKEPFITLLLDVGTEPYQGRILEPPITGILPPFIGFHPEQNWIIYSWNYPQNPFVTLLLGANEEPYEQSQITQLPAPPPIYTNWNIVLPAVDPDMFPETSEMIEVGSGTIFLLTYTPIGSTTPLTVLISWATYQQLQFAQAQEIAAIIQQLSLPRPATAILIAPDPPPTFMGAEQPWSDSSIAANPATFPTAPPITLNYNVTLFAFAPDSFPLEPDVVEVVIADIVPLPYLPIGTEVPLAVYEQWWAYQQTQIEQAAQIASLIQPSVTPPPVSASFAPVAQYQLLLPQQIADNPATFPTNPPFAGGAQMPLSVEITDYIPPPPTFMNDPSPWELIQIAPIIPPITNPPVGANTTASQPIRLWYPDFNPPPPTWMGSWQPWTGIRTADVLPVPTPPPTTGSLIPQAVLNAWNNPPRIEYLLQQGRQPYQGLLLPPPSAPSTPGAAIVPWAIYVAWYYQPPLVELLGPDTEPFAPAELPAPSGPQFPNSFPQAILDAWYWQDSPRGQGTIPSSIQQLTQLIQPPSIQNILQAWQPVPQTLQPLPAIGANPSTFPTPPPVVGSRISVAVLNWWIPPDEKKFQFQPQTNISPTLPIPTPPPIIRNPALDSIIASWYSQPIQLPQFSGQLTLSPAFASFPIIRAVVTITTQSVVTLIQTFGANVNLDT